MKINKKELEIESILPLKEIQKAMLFHHLHNEDDTGFLPVRFKVRGQVDKKLFEKAWQSTINRHCVIRSSVHWKKIKTPVQLIHKNLAPNFNYLDWTDVPAETYEDKLTSFCSSVARNEFDFEKSPLLNFYLIHLDLDTSIFIWPSHHLLVDGWSTNNMVEDALSYYDHYLNNNELSLVEIPKLKSYYGWLKNKQKESAENFWANYFENFESSSIIKISDKNNLESTQCIKKVHLSEENTAQLNALAKKSKVSVNILIQAAWALLLGAYNGSNDIVFGNAVSGRSNDFPHMNLLAGMFMNVLPQRVVFSNSDPISSWLTDIQKRQIEVLNFENTSITEIFNAMGQVEHETLFESLLIFENFPWNDKKIANLEIADFQSGTTTNYPITLVINPKKNLHFEFIFKPSKVSDSLVEWFIENWQAVLLALVNTENSNVASVIDTIKPYQKPLKSINTKEQIEQQTYSSPKNTAQFSLVKIWESMFKGSSIGIDDDFFDLGGTSLMAIRMFSLIKEKTGIDIPPTELLSTPTIRGLAKKINENTSAQPTDWEFLIPLRTKGSSNPLFCIHGGEGHVLFYKSLPKYLDSERPVYLLQPKGVSGEGPMHKSIEEMSAEYLNEILKVQKEGTFNILLFCYSAMAIELSALLENLGNTANFIIVDSSAQATESISKPSLSDRLKTYMSKLQYTPLMTLKTSIVYRYRRQIEPLYLKLIKDKTAIALSRIRQHLDTIYEEYDWKKMNSGCHLILTNKESLELREDKIRRWKHWTNDELNVEYTTGNHLNLFNEPHVKTLGEKVEKMCV